jgi:hypothetical protein
MATKTKSIVSAKVASKAAKKDVTSKTASEPAKLTKIGPKAAKESAAPQLNAPTSPVSEWLQDVSIEVPVPANANFLPGDRELEFSVGMRQQDMDGLVRSELRARGLVHARGEVLVLVEASYVNVVSQSEIRPDLPQYLYGKLRENMESLFALTGHTPPLPVSLEKVA